MQRKLLIKFTIIIQNYCLISDQLERTQNHNLEIQN
jgi:hypothetical protein